MMRYQRPDRARGNETERVFPNELEWARLFIEQRTRQKF